MTFRIITVAALALAFTLTGCTLDAGEPLDPIIGPAAVEVAPTPTVVPSPVAGDTLTAEQARVMNRDLTGDFRAYKLPDDTWVAIDKNAPLPESVLADVSVRAASDRTIDSIHQPSGVFSQLGILTYELGRTVYAATEFSMGCGDGGRTLVSAWAVLDGRTIHLTCSTRDEAIAFGEQLAASEGAVLVVVD